MGTHGVVILPPVLNDPFGLGQRAEGLGIQALIPQPAVKAFDMTVSRRLARPDELQFDSPLLRPAIKGLACKLWAVVRVDDCRTLPHGTQTFQGSRHPLAGQGVVRFNHRASPVKEIGHREHPEPSAIFQPIASEIHGPMLLRAGRPRLHDAQVADAFAAPFEPKRQPFLPIYTLDPLVIHDQPFPSQEDVQPGAAETPTFLGQFPQPDAQVCVAIRARRSPVRPTVHLHQLAGPPLGITMRLNDMTHGQAAFGGL